MKSGQEKDKGKEVGKITNLSGKMIPLDNGVFLESAKGGASDRRRQAHRLIDGLNANEIRQEEKMAKNNLEKIWKSICVLRSEIFKCFVFEEVVNFGKELFFHVGVLNDV